MIVSYKWLQTYFTEALPLPETLAELITFHIWEVEAVTPIMIEGVSDTLLDIKVLPDRSCYALSHVGVAYEVGAIIGQKATWVSDMVWADKGPLVEAGQKVTVNVESDFCRRYMGRLVENIVVGEARGPLHERLTALGQQSINSIVDIMNYVMFDLGQPLHAFDADLVEGAVTVRNAHDAEEITTLDNKSLTLSKDMMVIADEKGPLALAGIKGGSRAPVTEKTKRIIIEAACFDAATVRKTALKTGIRTDASKRFENNVPAELAQYAIDLATRLTLKENPKAIIGPVTDIYKEKETPISITINPNEISSILGIDLSSEAIKTILEKLSIKSIEESDALTVTIPFYRKDLRNKQDIAEEVGRLYGYDKLPASSLPVTVQSEEIIPAYFYEQKIRTILTQLGFSEVYTPTLVKDGDVVIANPLASDKRALRTSLVEGLTKALELNIRNAALLGLNSIKVFEIGTVFPKETETSVVGIAVADLVGKGKKGSIVLDTTLQKLSADLGVDVSKYFHVEKGICQIMLSDLVEKLPKPASYEKRLPSSPPMYKVFSPYPYIVRDIAVFVPETVSQDEVRQTILEKTGPLLVRHDLFDVFKKEIEGRVDVSYAFRLVFQSYERTLTDVEINSIMEGVSSILTQKGWNVR